MGKTLEAEKERLRITLRSIGDGVITTDIKGRVDMINRVAETLTGWSQDEARGKPLAEVFHIINEQTRQRCENPVEKVLKPARLSVWRTARYLFPVTVRKGFSRTVQRP